jgi:hypothetical protein
MDRAFSGQKEGVILGAHTAIAAYASRSAMERTITEQKRPVKPFAQKFPG